MIKPRLCIIALVLLLCGCGESVSERRNNERRDEAIRDVERSTEQRLQSLEDRIAVLERRP
jgi:hypothetical protein